MNANNKNIHSSLDESLEAFSPCPTYHQAKRVKPSIWLRFVFKKRIEDKHRENSH